MTHSTPEAFLHACRLDIQALKPGNVSLASPGHGMDASHFIASAKAAAEPLCRLRARVGQRIEDAVRASFDAAGCNTNLGIILLCAPLAAATEQCPPQPTPFQLRDAVTQVLHALDIPDAAAAYRAIALARPGGLGSAPEQDVASPPSINLRDAMALAADRDRIAWQYANGHADLFDLGLPAFETALHRSRTAGAGNEDAAIRAMQAACLQFLATLPDSHIVRKHGPLAVHSVMSEARQWNSRLHGDEDLQHDPAFAVWDESLKARGLNPGTSADLSVATSFVAALCHLIPA
ncbi:MAG TPA: triphosphoribosyl-dephospho-CoA synthase [Burkholderiaceae bacterium]|nr:triphosphoribosyl-dephospho-CoA synthase [Burkholderiaceae bacterium]